MRYLVCKKQFAEGCDHSIGCGMRYDFLEANSPDDAIEKTVYPDGRDSYCNLEGDLALAEILVIPADIVTKANMTALWEERSNRKKAEAKAQKEADELRELARLKEKYPNG